MSEDTYANLQTRLTNVRAALAKIEPKRGVTSFSDGDVSYTVDQQ